MACYLKLFVDSLEKYQKLSDSEFGRLVRAALRYKATGAEPDDLGREALLWDGMKLDIDRDNERQKSVNDSRAEAGRKGAESRWQKDGKNGKCHLPYSKNSYDKDKDKDKDKEKENTPKPPDAFDEFWAAYPKKKSKGAARKAWDKLKPSPEMRAMILRSIERAKQSSDWLEADGKYIPYPATWLNAEGWEDGVEEEKPREDPGKYAKPWPEFKPGMSWEDLIP